MEDKSRFRATVESQQPVKRSCGVGSYRRLLSDFVQFKYNSQ